MHTDCLELEAKIRNSQGVLKPGSRWGVVAALYVGPKRLEPMSSVPEVRALAGHGIEGDRYCREQGTFSKKSPSNQMTLIETEALRAAEQDYNVAITAEESRRNILTCGIALNHLVGREF